MNINTVRDAIRDYKNQFEQSSFRRFFRYFGYDYHPLVVAIEALCPEGIEEASVEQERDISMLLLQQITANTDLDLSEEERYELNYPTLESIFERAIRKEISGFEDKSQFKVYCGSLAQLRSTNLATRPMIEAVRTIIRSKTAYFTHMLNSVAIATAIFIQAVKNNGFTEEDVAFLASYIAKDYGAADGYRSVMQNIGQLKSAGILDPEMKRLLLHNAIRIHDFMNLLLDLNGEGILERVLPAIFRVLERPCDDHSMKTSNLRARIGAWIELNEHHLLYDETQLLVEKAPDTHRYASSFRSRELASSLITTVQAGISLQTILEVFSAVPEENAKRPFCLTVMVKLHIEKLPVFQCMQYLDQLCWSNRDAHANLDDMIQLFSFLAKNKLLTNEMIAYIKKTNKCLFTQPVDVDAMKQLHPALVSFETIQLTLQYFSPTTSDVVSSLNLLHKNNLDISAFVTGIKQCKDPFSFVARRLKRLDEAGKLTQENSMIAITNPAADMAITKLLSTPVLVAPVHVSISGKRKRKGKNHEEQVDERSKHAIN